MTPPVFQDTLKHGHLNQGFQMNDTRLKLALSGICMLAALPLAAQTSSPQAEPPSLPDGMFGSWALDQNDCIDPESESRMHVTSRSIDFAGNKLNIQRVRAVKGGWWRIDGTSREKGKPRQNRASVELRLSEAGRLTLRNGPEKPEQFVQCKPAQLQG